MSRERKVNIYIFIDFNSVSKHITRLNSITKSIIDNIEILEDIEVDKHIINTYIPTNSGNDAIKLIGDSSAIIPYTLKKSNSVMKMEIAMDALNTALENKNEDVIIAVLGSGNSWVRLLERINKIDKVSGYFCTMSTNIDEKHYNKIYGNKFIRCF